jgi:mannose-6-phosphate isomerase-like protein (cupin superfamily)/catechol 2,3-dioxygenase-like lactoylglutathione lyase family enzyme
MSVTDASAPPMQRQLATDPGTSRAWWFLGTLAVLRNPVGAPRTPAVIELTVPPGGSPPRHFHEALNDAFLLLEGEVVVRCGDETVVARPGTYVVVPPETEHTFRVTSRTPARMLLVHDDDSFLQFIESVGTPTTEHQLPPPGEFDVDGDTIVRISAEHGAPIVGPSLEDDDARSFLEPPSNELAVGGLHHLSIDVTDLRASERWYADVLGLVRVDGEIAPDGTGHLAMLHPASGCVVGLASAVAPRVEHVAFSCRDRDALVGWHTSLQQRGIEVGTITDAPYGSGFVLRDPDGLEVELFAPAGSAQ